MLVIKTGWSATELMVFTTELETCENGKEMRAHVYQEALQILKEMK